MDASQFEDHLDRYGADLSVWPPDLRRAAAALMTTSLPARRAFQATAEIEAVLRASPTADMATEASVDAMAARAMRHRQIRPVPAFARRAGWVGAAAAALVLGLVVGNLDTQRHDESPGNVMAAAFDSTGSSDVD